MSTVGKPDELRAYTLAILRRASILLAFLTLLGWTYETSVGLGLAVGGVFSMLKFQLRVNYLKRLHCGAESRAFAQAWSLSLSIYLATGALFFLAALRPGIGLAGVVAGVLLTNMVIVAERMVPWLRVFPHSPLDASS